MVRSVAQRVPVLNMGLSSHASPKIRAVVLRPLIVLLAASALALGLTAVRDAPRAASAGRPVLLVVTETAGFRHGEAIAAGLAELRRLGARRSGGFEVRELTRFAQLTPEELAGARGLVLLQTSGTPELDVAGRARLLSAVRGGLPLLAFHAASDTFHGWTAFHRMLGAEFRDHPNAGVGSVRVEDRSHPASRRLPPRFRLREEYYRFRRTPDPRRRAHVLVSLDVAGFGGRPRGDRPLVWWRTEQRGRVFYSALGHRPQTWRDGRHRRLLAGALDWALAGTR